MATKHNIAEKDTQEIILYRNLLACDTALETPLQRRIVNYCRRRKKFSFLAELVNYKHLDPALDAQIGEHGELEVVVAWARKEGRTAEELEARIKRDKRVNVVLPLAKLPGLSEELYAVLGEIDSINVAQTLASNPAVPFNIRRKQIKKIAQTPPRSKYMYNDFLKAFCIGTDDEITAGYQTIAANTLIPPHILSCFNKGVITTEHINRYVENFPEIYTLYGRKWWRETDETLTKIVTTDVSITCREALITALKTVYDPESKNMADTLLGKAITRLSNYDETLERNFDTLSNAQDSATADSLVKTLVTQCDTAGLARLVKIVANHEQVTTKVGLIFLGNMHYQELNAFVKKLERQGETEVLADILEDKQNMMYSLEDSASVLRVIVKRAIDNDTLIPTWAINVGAIDDDHDAGLRHTSWKLLAGRVVAAEGLDVIVAKTITETLGDDARNWETFSDLSEDFEGSLSELLAAACALSK